MMSCVCVCACMLLGVERMVWSAFNTKNVQTAPPPHTLASLDHVGRLNKRANFTIITENMRRKYRVKYILCLWGGLFHALTAHRCTAKVSLALIRAHHQQHQATERRAYDDKTKATYDCNKHHHHMSSWQFNAAAGQANRCFILINSEYDVLQLSINSCTIQHSNK